jgi:hypothetical protein
VHFDTPKIIEGYFKSGVANLIASEGLFNTSRFDASLCALNRSARSADMLAMYLTHYVDANESPNSTSADFAMLVELIAKHHNEYYLRLVDFGGFTVGPFQNLEHAMWISHMSGWEVQTTRVFV